jgi:subtilisin family serine protease
MGGNLPGELIGTAPEASYYLLRSEDGESEFLIEELNWVSAAEYADSVGADVINSSLGYTTFDDASMNHTYQDMDGNTAPITIGADIAASKGILVVNSAGNSGGGSWQYIGAPADGDSVFSIGAVNSSGSYASFSSTGPTYDGRTKPNVVAQGQGSAIANAWSGDITFGSGTSFSSPITAGMVACLWQAHPGARNTEIMAAIEQSGSLANNPNYQLGYGIPDYMVAHGLVTDSGAEIEAGREISIYPIPFGDYFVIRLDRIATSDLEVALVDVTGKMVFKTSIGFRSNQYRISGMGELPNGVYFLRVKEGNTSYTRKLVR